MADATLLEQFKARADLLREFGVDYTLDRSTCFPSAPAPASAAKRPARSSAAQQSRDPRQRGEPPSSPSAAEREGPAAAFSGSAKTLQQVREEIGDCKRCRLCEKRNTIVFGVGNPRARVLFVGEGPGADEDAQGIPFVGKAGQLLTDIIGKGMGLRRADVYIANVVKCRPPGNRVPQPDEVAACLPFLDAQIAAIRPEVIVALGATALQALLAAPAQITKVRGTWTDYRGVPLMPTFHPSYLLRNPAAKREVWQDIQAVMQKLGLPLPPPKG
jgi:uracil-DNA glycosylase family 4